VVGGGTSGGDVMKEDEEEVARRRKMETMKMTDFFFQTLAFDFSSFMP
jgi:hypothetical protein